jgi:hypothetical protein
VIGIARRFRSWSVVAATLCLVISIPGCSRAESEPIAIVDLVRELRAAETRPSPAAFDVADVLVSNQSQLAIRTIAPSRLIFTLAVPRRSTFVARVAVSSGLDGAPPQPVRFRVGVSDERLYEPLADVLVSPEAQAGWTEVRADLSAYAGWQWSVFYRPETRRWRLVLSADAVSGVRTWAAWALPSIVGDRSAAREYVERSAKLGR